MWWRVVVSCISHASAKVLPRAVTFCREIFCKSCFSNTWRRLLLTLPRNNQSLTYILQNFFKLFMRVITIFSVHFVSPLQSSFLQGWSENVIRYRQKCNADFIGTYFSRPRKSIFVNHKIIAVVKNRFYYKC